MITLSKENVVDYVKSRLNFFNLNGDIKVSAIGEGSVEEDGDGFINFVYSLQTRLQDIWQQHSFTLLNII